jgi:hypothetical protein
MRIYKYSDLTNEFKLVYTTRDDAPGVNSTTSLIIFPRAPMPNHGPIRSHFFNPKNYFPYPCDYLICFFFCFFLIKLMAT